MEAQELVSRISIILNKGYGNFEDTEYFRDKPHDELIEEFMEYLELHNEHIGNPHNEITHMLNEHGTDIVIDIDGIQIGFQIKSHQDLTDEDFARNVFAQMAESMAIRLAKWYILICAPNREFEGRINHLMNRINALQSIYQAYYSPRNTIQYFNNPEVLSTEKFNLELQRYSYQETSEERLLRAIERLEDEPQGQENILHIPDKTEPIYSKTLERISDICGWELEEHPEHFEKTKEDIDELLERLARLPEDSRRLLSLIVSRSETVPPGQYGVLAEEIRMELRTDTGTLWNLVNVLRRRDFAHFWEDYEEGNFIIVNRPNRDWLIWDELRNFCEETGINLLSLIVDLRFDYLDG